MEDITKIFKEKHLKVTKPRKEIYNFIVTHPIHPTAEVVFKEVQKKLPDISFATVYNVLNKFVEIGLIKEFKIGKEMHFDGNTAPHIHFICIHCGKVKDAKFEDYKKVIQTAQKEGWKVEEFSLFVYGICPDCRRKSNN